MIKNKICKVLYYSAISLMLLSCDNYVEDINTDPNEFLDTTPDLMLEGVMLSNQFWQNGAGARIAMIWMNQATGSDRQYVALNDWNAITASDFDDSWSEAYVGTIAQAQLGKENSLEANNTILAGAFEVFEAYSFGMVASLWGDIPFDEVNQFDEFPNPLFVSQTEVYENVQLLLDDAIEKLESGVGGIPEDQNLYPNADLVEIAHALKARFYLHVGDYENALAQAELGISSTDTDVNANFGSSHLVSFNPYYSFLFYDRPSYMSAIDAYAPQLLDATTDLYRGNDKTDESARFSYIYLTGENISNDGYELNLTNVFDGWGAEGKFGEDIQMLTYGEMLLIKAECELRLNGFDSGLSAYNEYRALLNTGYSFSTNTYGGGTFSYLAYDTTDFDDGGIENADGLSAEDALLREIMEERYVYFCGHLESFNDFKRTDNAAEIQLKAGFNGEPQRFLYSQAEINSNSNTPSPIPAVTETTEVNQ